MLIDGWGWRQSGEWCVLGIRVARVVVSYLRVSKPRAVKFEPPDSPLVAALGNLLWSSVAVSHYVHQKNPLTFSTSFSPVHQSFKAVTADHHPDLTCSVVLSPRRIAPFPFRYTSHFRDQGPRPLPLSSRNHGNLSAHKMASRSSQWIRFHRRSRSLCI